MNLHKMLRSFPFAFRGILFLFKHENNARFHLSATFLVFVLGLWLQISVSEWLVVVLAIGSVLSAEAFNTAIEKLADVVSPEFSQAIGIVKDLAAAAVLITSFVAVIVGILVFLPKLWLVLS